MGDWASVVEHARTTVRQVMVKDAAVKEAPWPQPRPFALVDFQPGGL